MLNWGIHNGSKEHKVKGRNNLTIMLFHDPTKGGITLRVPKWIRFPIMILAVAIVIGVLYTMSYIAQLQSQVAMNQSGVAERDYTILNKDQEIASLMETDSSRFDQLQALSSLTYQLKTELESLQAYKDQIDEKLNSTEKSTDAQPSKVAVVTEATEAVSLSSEELVSDGTFKTFIAEGPSHEEEVRAMTDTFSSEVERLLLDINDALEDIDSETTSLETREAQVDEILPFWDAYPSVLPVDDTYVTSPFGYRRNPFGGGYEFHSGVDFKAYYQDVYATGEGVVTYSGYNSGYGYMVIIDHGYGIITKYAHNSKLHVSEGEQVARYDVIATSGNSGRSSGPHLHYEILENGENQNPLDYLYEGEE